MKIFSTMLYFFKLNFLKILIYPRFRSAKDTDRLRFEWELCRIAASNGNTMFVGVHERSFVYELVFPFTFVDISDAYLVKAKSNVIHGSCIDVAEDFNLVILAGVLNYGTDGDVFKEILAKSNFKRFMIQDWKDNREFHSGWSNSMSEIVNLSRLFYYYLDGGSHKP